jgi:hypothetical protein
MYVSDCKLSEARFVSQVKDVICEGHTRGRNLPVLGD